MVYVRASIDNLDPTNNLLLRLSPNGIQKIIPPSTSASIEDEIRGFIELTPDAVSGSFQLEVSLAFREELKKLGMI